MTFSANALQPNPSASTVASALSDGDLDTALALARTAVKAAPSCADARLLLAELNLLAGELEKADLHAHAAGLHRPEWVPGLSVFRAHLRGLHARQSFYERATLPAFAGEPTEGDRLSMHLAVAVADGEPEAITLAREAVLASPARALASLDGAAAEAFFGLDNRIVRTIEAVSAGGDYLRIDVEKIERIIFDTSAPRRPRHAALRPARILLKTGDGADCAVPALYPTPPGEAPEPAVRLGHTTGWKDIQGISVGVGQICWLIGEDVVPMQDIGEVRFHAA